MPNTHRSSIADLTRVYRYELLDPRPGADNRHLLGACTLGIEITVPNLAAECGLGNIDPQHTASSASRAAIEEAVEAPLPPADACLVTVRPDPDAFGAMAVLAMRATASIWSRTRATALRSWHGRTDSLVVPGPVPGPYRGQWRTWQRKGQAARAWPQSEGLASTRR